MRSSFNLPLERRARHTAARGSSDDVLRFSLLYAFGLWLSLTAGAAVWPFIAPLLGEIRGEKGDGLAWAAVINLVPALVGSLGFLLGSATFGSRRPQAPRVRPARVALGLGILFPFTFLLRPVLGLLSAGLLPAIAWALVGSFFAAMLFGAIYRRR